MDTESILVNEEDLGSELSLGFPYLLAELELHFYCRPSPYIAPKHLFYLV